MPRRVRHGAGVHGSWNRRLAYPNMARGRDRAREDVGWTSGRSCGTRQRVERLIIERRLTATECRRCRRAAPRDACSRRITDCPRPGHRSLRPQTGAPPLYPRLPAPRRAGSRHPRTTIRRKHQVARETNTIISRAGLEERTVGGRRGTGHGQASRVRRIFPPPDDRAESTTGGRALAAQPSSRFPAPSKTARTQRAYPGNSRDCEPPGVIGHRDDSKASNGTRGMVAEEPPSLLPRCVKFCCICNKQCSTIAAPRTTGYALPLIPYQPLQVSRTAERSRWSTIRQPGSCSQWQRQLATRSRRARVTPPPWTSSTRSRTKN